MGVGKYFAAKWIGLSAAVLGGGLLIDRLTKPKKRKKKGGPDPWESEALGDLKVLSQFAVEDEAPVQLTPGERFWLRIDEQELGKRAAKPTIGSVDDKGASMPPCVMLEAEVRRGTVRYIPIRANAISAYCSTYVAWDTVPASSAADGWLGFKIRIEPPLAVGQRAHYDHRDRRASGIEGGHIVVEVPRPKRLDCQGYVLGHITAILPPGDYEAIARCSGGADCVLVDLETRKSETVATWLVTKGGHLLLEHTAIGSNEKFVLAVEATDPVSRAGRL